MMDFYDWLKTPASGAKKPKEEKPPIRLPHGMSDMAAFQMWGGIRP